MDATTAHTLALFQRLFEQTQDYLPASLTRAMRTALEDIVNHSPTAMDIEDVMIQFGMRIWPYRKAFQSFVDMYERQVGERLLSQKLSPAMKKRFRAYMVAGGTIRELHAGKPAQFFSPEERVALCEALVGMNQALRKHALQAIKSTDKKTYDQRVEQYHDTLDGIREQLSTLRSFVAHQQSDAILTKDMAQQIRDFELSFALVGPETTLDAVCQAVDRFRVRRLAVSSAVR